MKNINLINQTIEAYFEKNKDVKIIRAKDLMPEFITAGIFSQDHRNGLPIREILRELDENNKLDLIPYVVAERKTINTNWYFQRIDK